MTRSRTPEGGTGAQQTAAKVGAFRPVKIADLELATPLEPVPLGRPSGGHYARARILVRLHGVPLNEFHWEGSGAELTPDIYAPLIWQQMAPEIRARFVENGVREPEGLTLEVLRTLRGSGSRAPAQHAAVEQPKVSVVLCTHERSSELVRTLSALSVQDTPHFEVVVVDNAPATDRTERLVRDVAAKDSRVRYVRENRRGLSRARNTGIANSDGDVIAFTDDDARPDISWVSEVARAFVDPDVACVSGPVLPAEIETPAQEWFEQYGGHTKGRGFRRARFDGHLMKRRDLLFPSPPFGVGVNMAFRAEVLRAIGGFDPCLGAGTPTHGGEDTDAFYRVVRLGRVMEYRPTLLVRHVHRRDLDGLRAQFHGYGVGLTAFYLHRIRREPAVIFTLASLMPRAVQYMVDPRSSRTSGLGDDYPDELKGAQVRGMLLGAPKYVRSWAAVLSADLLARRVS